MVAASGRVVQGWFQAALLVLGLLMGSASVAAPAAAAEAPAAAATLSPRLTELAKPSVRGLPAARQARALSLARSGAGSLLRDGNRVLVYVRFDHGAAASAAELRAAGGQVVNVSRRYQTVTVAVRPASLHALAATKNVQGVSEILTPITAAAGCSGLTTSEGDVQLLASEARADFNVDGSGVTVGILSDSFDQAQLAADGVEPVATHAAEDVASGDLPGPGNPCGHTAPVEVLESYSPGPEEPEATDEGRAMAQIVHDLAPGASLAFASASNGEFAFAENIERLARSVVKGGAGARVIADDVTYLDEPFFQDGPVAVAAGSATKVGAAYFSAAGNDNLLDAEGHEIGSWEAPEFRNPGSCPAGLPVYASRCMDFDAGPGADNGFGITVEPEETVTVDLQWAQPWFGVTTDFDAYLLSGSTVVAKSEFPNADPGFQEPVEILSWTNPSSTEPAAVELAINQCDEACGTVRAAANLELLGTKGGDRATPRLKFALSSSGVSETEYPESKGGDIVGPTIFGHAGATSAIGVGAVRFNTNSEPEEFSSRGPVTHYFGPVSSTAPAGKLPAAETISKPDIAATDCGVSTFFAFKDAGGNWRFCGTSAAAPHAAAVAALMRQANPSLSPGQVRTTLADTARPVGPFGADAVGAGLIDAFSAVAAIASPPTITITERPAAVSKERTPHIGFTANRPVAFACALDGGAFEPCASPFAPLRPLADGVHGVVVRGVDVVGMTGTSETVRFAVDTTPPRTFFRRHPRKVIRTHHRKVKAAFRFGSNEGAVTFTCRVDGGLLRVCPERFVRRFRVGMHSMRVFARDVVGNVDATPAVYRFRIKRAG